VRKILGTLLMLPGAFIAVLVVQSLGAEILQRVIVTSLYSKSAYASGLRFSIKKGFFSNGDPVPWWTFTPFLLLVAMDAMTFFIVFTLGARLARTDLRRD
jgi:hypothetical protein